MTLIALGAPLPWKKTVLPCINVWVGFQVRTQGVNGDRSTGKATGRGPFPEGSCGKEKMLYKEIEQLLRRLVWASGCCAQLKPFLQPSFAWKEKMSKVHGPGTPS